MEKCTKKFMTNLLQLIKNDCRSRTGANLRNIMLRTTTTNIVQLESTDVKKLIYKEIPKPDEWKITTVKELVDCQHNILSIPGFNHQEIEEIKHHICIS